MIKRILIFLLVFLGWFAILAQYVLILENKTASFSETTLRFFSYFTILTNVMVACYFTRIAFIKTKPEPYIFLGTAITVYIVIVGLVYQFVLRKTWEPTGLQMVVDELLHTVIPLGVVVYWSFFTTKIKMSYAKIFYWLIYPLIYLCFILVRGRFSNFYPYPFIDVSKIGIKNTLFNSMILLFGFIAISAVFVYIGNRLGKNTSQPKMQ